MLRFQTYVLKPGVSAFVWFVGFGTFSFIRAQVLFVEFFCGKLRILDYMLIRIIGSRRKDLKVYIRFMYVLSFDSFFTFWRLTFLLSRFVRFGLLVVTRFEPRSAIRFETQRFTFQVLGS